MEDQKRWVCYTLIYHWFKGVDMYIESLWQLNNLLKQQGSKLTVVAFIIMPAKTNNFNVESLKGHSFIRDMRKTVGSIVEAMSERMFDAIAQGQVRALLPRIDPITVLNICSSQNLKTSLKRKRWLC
jgi:Glycogen synthase